MRGFQRLHRATLPVFAALLIALAQAATAGCVINVDADQYTVREEKRFNVSGVPDLTLATFDGSIEIRSWDRPEIEVIIEKRGPDKEAAAKIEVSAEQSGNRITVEARRPRDGHRVLRIGFHVDHGVKLIASVPAETNLLARSGDGSITVERVNGRLELRTGDGSIRGTRLAGQLRAHTGDGSVKLDEVAGDLDLDTGDGSIVVQGKLGTVRARSGDGSIQVTADSGSAMSDDWDIRTGDGAVRVDLPDGFAAELDAHSGDGRVRLEELQVTTTGEISRDTLRAKLGGGGRSLKIRTGDGSITLRKS